MPPSPGPSTSTPITRRRLAALGAASGSALLLAACGTDADPNSDRSDEELLGYIREMQSAVADAWEGQSAQIGGIFAAQAKSLLDDLDKALADAGAEGPPKATFSADLPDGAPAALEASLIGVVNAVVPSLGDDDLKELAYRVSAASAGRIATLTVSEDPGADPSPDAFVLGTLPDGFEGVD